MKRIRLIPIEETPYTVEQRRLIFIFSGAAVFCLIAIFAMSILGAREASFHLISLEIGWGAKVWDALWLSATASFFFIIGGICFTALKENIK
ncbi:hypothetical protein LCGC14_1595870 [marine sediment metagenome]|uniref:Uncharacterized protein n=1 Tax=marine sediment metagenome TaxID=412755 RepID=A0A0F9ICZ5_9ZZZZ